MAGFGHPEIFHIGGAQHRKFAARLLLDLSIDRYDAHALGARQLGSWRRRSDYLGRTHERSHKPTADESGDDADNDDTLRGDHNLVLPEIDWR
jgi:hypothetical protein